MLALRVSRAPQLRKKLRTRALRLEPLEQRQLLAVDSQFNNGVLSVTTNDDDEIVLSSLDGFAKINGTDPSIQQIATSDVKVVRLEGGPETRTIDVSGFSRSNYPSLEHLIFNNGPWVEPTKTLAVLDETLGPGWAEKLAIMDPRGYLISGDWKGTLADGSLTKRLTAAGWGNAQGLLDRVVQETEQRAVIRSVRFTSADDLDFDVLFNGKLDDGATTPTSDEPGPVTMALGGGGGGEGGDDGPPEDESTIFISNATDYEPAAGTGWLSFTVYISEGSDFSFDWQTYDSSATSGGANPDYTSAPLTHVAVSGASTTISVAILGDDLYEFTESFQVHLSNISGAQAGGGVNGYGTILNSPEDVPPSIYISSPNPVGEPMEAGDPAALVFTVNLSHASGVPVAFDWNTVDVTANQFDYDQVPVAEHVIIGAGSIYAQLVLTVRGDDLYEPQETFNVELSNLNYATAGWMTAHGTIVDSDRAVVEQTKYVPENSPAGISVGAVELASEFVPAVGSPVFTVLGGTGASYFAVDSASGDITVTDGSAFDFESGPSAYTLQLRVASSEDPDIFDIATITIEVTNVYEVPSTPRLDIDSDSGFLQDALTSADYPMLIGSAETGDTIELLCDGIVAGSQVITDGVYAIALTQLLAEGPHAIRARATTEGGQTTDSLDSLILTIDRSAAPVPGQPLLDLLSDSGESLDNLTNVTAPTFVGTAELGATIHIFSDGSLVGSGIAAGGQYRIVVSDLGVGTHTHEIRAIAIDAAGNISGLSNSSSVTIDTQAPGAPLAPLLDPASDSGALNGVTKVLSPVVIGTASGATLAEVFADGVLVGKGPVDNGEYSIQLRRLAPGIRFLTVVAVDAAGNHSVESDSTSIVIKPAPNAPSKPVLRATDDSGASSTDQITNVVLPAFTGTAESGTSVNVFVDGILAGSSNAIGGTYGVQIATLNALSAGTHAITANAVDVDGSTSELSDGTVLIVLLSASSPMAPALALESDSGSSNTDRLTNVKRPTFVGIAAPGSLVQLLIDGVPAVTSLTADGFYSITLAEDLPDGESIVSAVATDLAGNISSISDSTTITIDTTRPAAPLVPQMDAQADKTFVGTALAGLLVTIFCDGVAVGTGTADENGNYEIVGAAIAHGTHSITATVTKPITGSTSDSSPALSITIDAPEFNLSDAGIVLGQHAVVNIGVTPAGKAVTHTFTVSNNGTADLELYAPNLPQGFSLAEAYGSSLLAPGESTTFSVRLDASEAGDFEGQVVFGSNDSRLSPFSIQLSGQVTSKWILDDEDAGFTLSQAGWLLAEQVDSEAYRGGYRLSNPADQITSTATWTFGGLSDGIYRVHANWIGHEDASDSIVYDISDVPSHFQSVYVDQSEDSTGLTEAGIQWQQLSDGFQVAGGVLTVKLYGSNFGSFAADSVRIERLTNHAPFFDPISNQAARAETLLSFSVTASDSDNDSLQYSLGPGAPEGVELTSAGVFSWTPTSEQAGQTFNIQVIVADDRLPALTASQDIAITVYSANQAPTVAPVGDQSINAALQLNVQIAAFDPDGPLDSLAFSVDGLEGAAITSTGLLSWTPTVGQANDTYPVTVTVEDGEGLETQVTFNVAVNQVAPALTLASVTDLALVNDTGTVNDNVTSDRRIRGQVINSGASVDNLSVQFDANDNGIADGSVRTSSGGDFVVDLTNVVQSDGPVTVKFRAGTPTATGIVYGEWSEATFTFETPPIASAAVTTYLPADIGGLSFATGSLAPAITIPEEGTTVNFAGNITYGTAFPLFADRFLGVGAFDTTTISDVTSYEPSGGPGLPAVKTTESTNDHSVAHVFPDGSWQIDQAFYYSYIVTSVVLAGTSPTSTLVQSGFHTILFHAAGNSIAASYTLAETRGDRVVIQRATIESTTQDGIVRTVSDATASDESQGFSLGASGWATFDDGAMTSSEEFLADASGVAAFSNRHDDSETHNDWQELSTVLEDDGKGWTYAYDRSVNSDASGVSGSDHFEYSNDDNILHYLASTTYTSSIHESVGSITSDNDVAQNTTLAGSWAKAYDLVGDRINNVDMTWSAAVHDHQLDDLQYEIGVTDAEITRVDDNTPNSQSSSKSTFNSSTDRTESQVTEFQGDTVTLANSTATYSGTIDVQSQTDYSWSGDERDLFTGQDDSVPGESISFGSDVTSTNQGNGSISFLSSSAVAVDAANKRTVELTSSYDEAKHSESTWDRSDWDKADLVDVSVPDTQTSSTSSNKSTDVGQSSYDMIRGDTFVQHANGSTIANGSGQTTYSGVGDSTFDGSESVHISYDSDSNGVSRTNDDQVSSRDSSATHYETAGARGYTIDNGIRSDYESDTVDESGSETSSESGDITSSFKNDASDDYYAESFDSLSWSDNSQSTFTQLLADSKTTYNDGHWSSSGSSSYTENGSTASRDASSAWSIIDDLTTDELEKHSSGQDSSSSTRTGTYSITDKAATARLITGAATNKNTNTQISNGTSTSQSSSRSTSVTIDNRVKGITSVANSDSSRSEAGTGTYSSNHSDSSQTNPQGIFTATTNDQQTDHSTATSRAASISGQKSFGSIDDGQSVTSFAKSVTSSERRVGTLTTDDSSTSSMAADGTRQSSDNLNVTDTGNLTTASTSDDSSTTVFPTEVTNKWSFASESRNGTFNNTDVELRNTFTNGKQSSSTTATGQTDGTTTFASSAGSLSLKATPTTNTVDLGDDVSTVTTDKTSSVYAATSENGTGTFHTTGKNSTAVDINGVLTVGSDEFSHSTDDGTSASISSAWNKFDEHDVTFDPVLGVDFYTRDVDGSSASNKTMRGTFSRESYSDTHQSFGITTASTIWDTDKDAGTFISSSSSSQTSHEIDQVTAGISKKVDVDVDSSSYQVPNGSYAWQSKNESHVYPDRPSDSTSTSSMNASGTSITASHFDSTEVQTDKRVAGVATSNSTHETSVLDGHGSFKGVDTDSAINGATRTTHLRNEDESGHLDRSSTVHNTSSGAPDSAKVVGTTYTTNPTASSSFDQSSTDDGSYDSKSEDFNVIVGSKTVASEQIVHEHENYDVDLNQSEQSDSGAAGTTAQGATFDNTYHLDSHTDNAWTEDDVNDRKTTFTKNATTGSTGNTAKVTGGSGTFESSTITHGLESTTTGSTTKTIKNDATVDEDTKIAFHWETADTTNTAADGSITATHSEDSETTASPGGAFAHRDQTTKKETVTDASTGGSGSITDTVTNTHSLTITTTDDIDGVGVDKTTLTTTKANGSGQKDVLHVEDISATETKGTAVATGLVTITRTRTEKNQTTTSYDLDGTSVAYQDAAVSNTASLHATRNDHAVTDGSSETTETVNDVRPDTTSTTVTTIGTKTGDVTDSTMTSALDPTTGKINKSSITTNYIDTGEQYASSDSTVDVNAGSSLSHTITETHIGHSGATTYRKYHQKYDGSTMTTGTGGMVSKTDNHSVDDVSFTDDASTSTQTYINDHTDNGSASTTWTASNSNTSSSSDSHTNSKVVQTQQGAILQQIRDESSDYTSQRKGQPPYLPLYQEDVTDNYNSQVVGTLIAGASTVTGYTYTGHRDEKYTQPSGDYTQSVTDITGGTVVNAGTVQTTQTYTYSWNGGHSDPTVSHPQHAESISSQSGTGVASEVISFVYPPSFLETLLTQAGSLVASTSSILSTVSSYVSAGIGAAADYITANSGTFINVVMAPLDSGLGLLQEAAWNAVDAAVESFNDESALLKSQGYTTVQAALLTIADKFGSAIGDDALANIIDRKNRAGAPLSKLETAGYGVLFVGQYAGAVLTVLGGLDASRALGIFAGVSPAGAGHVAGGLVEAELAETASSSGTALARELGVAGEEAAGIVKNTTRIDSLSGTRAFRIPDGLTETTLTEVKNVAELSFNQQLQDSLHFALMTGRDFVLKVRPTTSLSQPLRDAIEAGYIILEFLP